MESRCIFAEGIADLRFSGLNVFWSTSPEKGEIEAYEVRSHPAVLRLRGLTSVSGGCVWEPNVSVYDAEVFDVSGEEVWWNELLTSRRIQRLKIRFDTGDVLKLHAEEAHLILEGEGEYLERWSGPFISQPDPGGREGS